MFYHRLWPKKRDFPAGLREDVFLEETIKEHESEEL